MAMESYGRAPRASVLQPQQVASGSPLAHEEVVEGPKLDRVFWKQTLIEGVAAATTSVMVYFVMREIEKRWK
jgi:hypothetical protein